MLNLKTELNDGNVALTDIQSYVSKYGKKLGVTTVGHMLEVPRVERFEQETKLNIPLGVELVFKTVATEIHLVFYPKNNDAKRRLIRLVTACNAEENFKGFPLNFLKEMQDFKAVINLEKTPSWKEAVKGVLIYMPNTDVYLGVTEEMPFDTLVNVKKMMNEFKLKYVNFTEKKFVFEQQLHNTKVFLKVLDGELLKDEELYPLGVETGKKEILEDIMKPFKEASDEIFNLRYSWKIETSEIKIPSFSVPKEFQVPNNFLTIFADFVKANEQKPNKIRSAAYLFTMAFRQLVVKLGKEDVEAFERVQKELKIIIEKGYADYFLIVADFFAIGRKNNIKFGPGRGSVCASLVAYLMGITVINPLKYGLIFERFLNMNRMDFPDIDIDVSSRDRELLISAIIEKYGEEFVAQIGTKGRLGFKNFEREYLKHVVVNPKRMEELRRCKPETFDTLEELLASPEVGDTVKNLMIRSKDIRLFLEAAFTIKNSVKSIGRHAAGLLISSEPFRDFIPMSTVDGKRVTQYTFDEDVLEKMGALKFDILGLRNVDIKYDAMNLIEKRHRIKLSEEFPLDDKNTLELFKAGQLKGVFQMESEGMMNYAKKIGISNFSEVVALNAMYRPGPMDFIPLFADIKNGIKKQEVIPGMECLNPILNETYGIIVYQEQINQIAIVWANYTPSEAEVFRQAISKSNEEKMLNERSRFIEKALQTGRDKSQTLQLVDTIMKFADFGYNKAHAVVYALLCYETAYLKANYSIEYMTSLLNSVIGKPKKTAEYINECKALNIQVLPIDMNLSSDKFVIEGNAIRMPFQVVSGIGDRVSQLFVEKRGAKKFVNYVDFKNFYKGHSNLFSNALLEKLALLGAFNELGNKYLILADLRKVPEVKPLTIAEELKLEMEYCGILLHPEHSAMSKAMEMTKDNPNALFGIVSKLEETKDKYQKDMAKVQVEPFEGDKKYLVIFSRDWKKFKDTFSQGDIVILRKEDNVIKDIKKM